MAKNIKAEEYKKGGNLSYKGLPIHKEHPSGMYSFFSEKRKRFLKYDSLDEVKKHIDSEIKMAKGGRVKGNWKIEISFKKGTKYYNRMPQITYMKYGITKDDAMWYVNNLNDNDEVKTYSITKIPPLAEKKLKFDDLIGKTFPIEIGSYDRKKTWTKEELYNALLIAFKHNLFDSEFYYNYSDKSKEYLSAFAETQQKMFADVDNVLNKYFKFTTTAYSTKEEVLVFKNKDADNRKFINDWFKNNKKISPELKRQYKLYREEYAGETPYAKGGNMNSNLSIFDSLKKGDNVTIQYTKSKDYKITKNLIVDYRNKIGVGKKHQEAEIIKLSEVGKSDGLHFVFYKTTLDNKLEFAIKNDDYKDGMQGINNVKLSLKNNMAQGGNTDVLLIAYGDSDYDNKIGHFTSKKMAKHFAKQNVDKYDTIMFEDFYGDTIVVYKGDTNEDIDWLFNDSMAKGGLLGGFNYSIGGL